MRVLIACEVSGIVRDAMLAAGHDAMSCDIQPSDHPGPHYHGDVIDLLHEPFDLVIAHPPCTFLSLSGARWLYDSFGQRVPSRWDAMGSAAEFFAIMFSFNSPRIAVENPIQHGHAMQAHGCGKYSQIVHPWQFGHPEKKSHLPVVSRVTKTDSNQ